VENLEGAGHARAGALYQEPLFDASTAPPRFQLQPSTAFSRTCDGFFYAELISEALTRHKMAAGVTALVAEWRSGAKMADVLIVGRAPPGSRLIPIPNGGPLRTGTVWWSASIIPFGTVRVWVSFGCSGLPVSIGTGLVRVPIVMRAVVVVIGICAPVMLQ
jgi:hypothetical protein